MKQINYVLGYPDLKIYQDTDMFHFSLDSILLPNFVTLRTTVKNILDIGSGNAIIPLILSKKTKDNVQITGVELQKEVYELGKESIALNHLDERISFYCDDIREFAKKQETETYDVITCNPPFFKKNENSHLNESLYKQIARHEITLCLEEILQIGRKLLKNNGILAIVHRPERLVEMIELFKKYNIEPKRIRFVYPKKDKDANILLIEGVKNGNPGLKIEAPLYSHEENGQYTEQIERYFR